MLDKYLRGEETLHGRLDDLLDQARRTNSTTVKASALAEAQVLATVEQTFLAPATVTYNNTSTLDGIMGEVYTADQVAKALDNAFEGGQAPAALKGAVLALLVEPDGDPITGLVIGDSSLVPHDADGKSAQVEGDGHPYIDTSGVDFDAEMPDDADEADDEFPEFGKWGGEFEAPHAPEPDPLEATITKPKKKGGKKTAAQRAAEEAGL